MTHTSNKSMWQNTLQEFLTMVDNNVSILEWISTSACLSLTSASESTSGFVKNTTFTGTYSSPTDKKKKKSKRWDLKRCFVFWNFPGCFFVYTKILSPLELCPGCRHSPVVRVFASYTQNPWLNSQHHINQELLCLSLIPALGGWR